MKLRTLGLVALVATLGLASCKKEEGPAVKQEPKSIAINLANVAPMTRADLSAPITDGAQVVLNEFSVFFIKGTELTQDGKTVDGTKAAPHYFKKNEQGEWEAFTNKAFPENDADLTTDKFVVNDNILFHFLDATVTGVVIVANLGQKTTTDYANLDALKAELAIADNQNCANLPLYGEDTELSKAAGKEQGTPHPLYQADVNLTPLISRIEISGFEYASTGTEDADNNAETPETEIARNYTSISVDQVVLNNYYPKAQLSTATATGTPENLYIDKYNVWDFLNGSNSTAGQHPTWANYVLTDTDLAASGYVHTYTATCPAFNFFPNGTGITSVDDGQNNGHYPELVVKLTGKKDDETTPLYLATETFVKDDNSAMSTDVAKVYRMNFKFTDTDLTNPLKCIEVNVTVEEWEVIDVTPTFGNK